MRTEPYVIAELGSNHGGDIRLAKEMIDAAKWSGADAVKLQKRDNENLFTKEMFNKTYTGPNSYGNTYGEHRMALELSEETFVELKAYADEKGIDFFATPFDIKSLRFLARLGVPQIKIASASVINIPLLEAAMDTKLPVIMSLGGQGIKEIKEADYIFPEDYPLTLLHCVAAYPTPADRMNLFRITWIREQFPYREVGLSDHQDGIALGPAAYMLGARVFEKHFTLNHSARGTDNAFSLEPEGMRKYVKYLMMAHDASIYFEQPMPDEEAPIRKMAQSVYFARDIPAGTKLTPLDVALKSPGGFISPAALQQILFRTVLKDVKEDQPVDWDLIK